MIIAFTSLTPSGATFMDWSWHWLKGNDHCWIQEKGWIPLVDDPLADGTIWAHGHQKNHLSTFAQWKVFLELASKETQGSKDISFYPFIMSTANNLNEYVDHLNWCVKEKVSVVVIKKTQVFPYASEKIDKKSSDDLRFFLNSNPDIPRDTTRKKLREIVSIRMDSQQKTWLQKINQSFELLDKEVIVISDKEWIDQTEEIMVKIFRKLGTKIHPERLIKWREIADRWREKHEKKEIFYTHEIPKISDKIVAGESMDLREFNFGFADESLIMMHIMKRHGKKLVLPGDNFPMDTAKLHRFLK